MNKIFKSALLVLAAVAFTACDKDIDSNPVLQTPASFKLNAPAMAASSVYDLAKCNAIVFTASQPDYGFPAEVEYQMQYGLSADGEFTTIDKVFATPNMTVDGQIVAVALTNAAVEKGEIDFPKQHPVYFRAMATLNGNVTYSNAVALEKCYYDFSLPEMQYPEELYITGNFCGWSWDEGKCLKMVPVYDHPELLWHMVWIDESGIKFNQAMAWDGGEVGYNGCKNITDLTGNIGAASDGNINSQTPGWYLMIVESVIEGREILYNVQFQTPDVYLIGGTTGGQWTAAMPDWKFDVPADKDGDFVSPAFIAEAPEGPRAHIQIDGFGGVDWWKTEFMVFDKVLIYRGAGDDQDRVPVPAGQKLYINFAKETGDIK